LFKIVDSNGVKNGSGYEAVTITAVPSPFNVELTTSFELFK